ncbi:Crp/Fnr family transcriptional regulator [Polaribacter sp. WD7]|uniref:Crp/Fnr family transcriptional regulator n=1 Tax=Polaribacter sp. WD7 TaxID=2269061 RepID=UPI000DF44A5D|nr:Crp/Fnr family transcriptional regulator [Polaribacter sp. WD7]RCS28144.1 Crp/Fnr family transcriptional regulator [Polaribacter sp. WD7]
MKFLTQFIDKIGDIPESSLKKLTALISLKELKKGDIIAKAGEIPNDIYILKSGIIRSFFTDEKGKEYIRHIFTPVRATGALGAMILNKPSRFSYDCLLDCEVYSLNFKLFKKLSIDDKAISNLYATVLEYVFLSLEAKVYDLSVLNATERYLKLKKQIPDIENLIPQYHIASYLNITPVQLSRIRKEIYSK